MKFRIKIRMFWLRQRRAWMELIGSEPKPIDIGYSIHSSHPSADCVCAGVPFDWPTAAQAVHHHPDCPWLKVMCKACYGAGNCSRCYGDGVDPFPDQPPPGAVGIDFP